MKKLSTQCMDFMSNNNEKQLDKKSSPRKQTIDFISQFARVYCSQKTLTTKQYDFVLN